MKYFRWILIATCVILSMYLILTPRPAKPKTVAITIPDLKQAERITKLEARVDLLETWAIRHGGKLK